MSDDLETLYKVLTREQTRGYSGFSVLRSFEEFLADWCDGVLAGNSDQHVQRLVHDMKSAAEGYGTATQETRERKAAEMGRMLLSLRDILQQMPDSYGTPVVSQPPHHKIRPYGRMLLNRIAGVFLS
jgi:hypothetical protein